MNKNVSQTLDSLKSAMTADEDQVLENDYDEGLNTKEEKPSFDEVVETFEPEAFNNEVEDESKTSVEEVFCSKKEDEAYLTKKTVQQVSNDSDVFVLTKMIQEDGTILNLQIAEPPEKSINISDEDMKDIIREEARPFLKEWIEKHMHKKHVKVK